MIRKIYRLLLPQALRIYNRRLLNTIKFTLTGQEYKIAKHLVGMTTLDEQEFYKNSVAEVSQIEGAILDLGCWMGSTTISLARGVEYSNMGNEKLVKVYAFDRFIWEQWMDSLMPSLNCDYVNGDSFLPETRGRLREYRNTVELIKCDLTNYAWKGGKIKLLLVDAMKNSDLTLSITMNFFQHLVKGSLVIHQDFKFYGCPWIHILQYRLRDYFGFHYEVTNGYTVVLETKTKISKQTLQSVVFSSLDYISDQEVQSAFDYSLTLVGEQGKLAVQAARVMFYVHTGQKGKAEELMDAQADLIESSNDLKKVYEEVKSM